MDTLTDRQREVLRLWLEGNTQRQVAAALGVSVQTVNPHLKVIARKLGTPVTASGGHQISRSAFRDASSLAVGGR